MKIGIPKEIKNNEFRVGMTAAGTRLLTKNGHTVYVQKDAGLGSGIGNKEFEDSGAKILSGAEEIYAQADMIIKVKEPLPEEWKWFKEDQILFSYIHLAGNKELAVDLMNKGSTAIAFETVTDKKGYLPLLIPMSQIAGRMSVEAGAYCLQAHRDGKGLLLGGVPGVEKGKVLILGGGVVGTNAAIIAVGMGAEVVIMDLSVKRMNELENLFGSRIKTIFSDQAAIEKYIQWADLVIGSVLIPGASAPKLISKEMVGSMEAGSAIVDVCIDHGGCAETSRPTSHETPTYLADEVVHYCVTNIPGIVPYSSTFALNNSVIPYALRLADKGLGALKEDRGFLQGLNIHEGKITHRALAESLDLPCSEAARVL